MMTRLVMMIIMMMKLIMIMTRLAMMMMGGSDLDSFLGVTHTGSVRVMKRSEERLYTNSVKQLGELLEAEINLDALPQAQLRQGAHGVTLSVCLSVRLAQTCLKL